MLPLLKAGQSIADAVWGESTTTSAGIRVTHPQMDTEDWISSSTRNQDLRKALPACNWLDPEAGGAFFAYLLLEIRKLFRDRNLLAPLPNLSALSDPCQHSCLWVSIIDLFFCCSNTFICNDFHLFALKIINKCRMFHINVWRSPFLPHQGASA